MTPKGIDIADLFSSADAALWRERANAALKGGGIEHLIASTPEGVTLAPLHPRAATQSSRALRQGPGAWRISQRMDHPDISSANKMALADLENGAGALTLAVARAPGGRGFGVEIEGENDLDAALDGVELDLISVRLDAGARAAEIARAFALVARKRRLTAAALDVDFGYDPIGDFAKSGAKRGAMPATAAEIGREASHLRLALREGGFAGHFFLADGRPYHDAGAGDAQELAAVLAAGLDYLRLLEAEGADIEEARDEISFLLAADADAFLSLAKFRALRRLWAQVETACGLAPKPIRLHAETSYRMMTRRDPWVNILRATLGAFSAGLGGADAITILPFTLALGLPDDFARRLARNAQLLLIHEANLAKVADPAAGAGGFEALTDQLCAKAWTLLQRFERSGGMLKSLEAGWPQQEIAATAAARREAIAHGTQAITGSTAFPDLGETPVPVLARVPAADAAPAPSGAGCAPLSAHRDAEPYENLRAASDAAFARMGVRPKIFLANLGAIESCLGRSIFAKNLFEAAGVEATAGAGLGTAQEAAEAFRLSGSKIACICASDSINEETAIAAARAIGAAGAALVYFAGPKGTKETALREAGVAGFVHPGCNALAILEAALARAVENL